MLSTEVIDLLDDSDDNESVISENSMFSQNSKYSSQSSICHVEQSVIDQSISQCSTTSDAGKPRKKLKTTQKYRSNIEREIQRQLSGKFKYEEVGIVLSNTLQGSDLSKNLLLQFEAEDPKFGGLLFHDSFANNSIRWTFRPKLLGGKAKINDDHAIVLPFAVIIYPVEEFLRLLKASTDPYFFKELGKSLEETISVLCNLDGCPKDSRVSFVLINLDNEILKSRKVQ